MPINWQWKCTYMYYSKKSASYNIVKYSKLEYLPLYKRTSQHECICIISSKWFLVLNHRLLNVNILSVANCPSFSITHGLHTVLVRRSSIFFHAGDWCVHRPGSATGYWGRQEKGTGEKYIEVAVTHIHTVLFVWCSSLTNEHFGEFFFSASFNYDPCTCSNWKLIVTSWLRGRR